MSTRIVLADDNPDVRSGIRLLLKAAPDLKIVGEDPKAFGTRGGLFEEG